MAEANEFESLVLTSKRITNILKKQEKSIEVDPDLFKESCEVKLWEAYGGLKDNILKLMEKKDYYEALNLVIRLRKPVDDFFDEVEILTKEHPQLRDNRVAVLQTLAGLFKSIADFSKFSI